MEKCRKFFTELHLRKPATNWVPHKLISEQKRERVNVAHDLLGHFEPGGPKCVSDVITEETWVPFYKCVSDVITGETWIQFYGIASKHRKKSMSGSKQLDTKFAKPTFLSRKRMFTIFFNHNGPVAVDVWPAKSTITGSYHAQGCSKLSRRSATSIQSIPPRTSSFSTTMPVPIKHR